jgi:hypothetical protein
MIFLHIHILASKTHCYHFLAIKYLLELYSNNDFNFVETYLIIQLQQVFIGQNMDIISEQGTLFIDFFVSISMEKIPLDYFNFVFQNTLRGSFLTPTGSFP